MKKISRLLLLLLLAVLLINCASFSNTDFKNDYTKINESELNSFNGKYSFFPIKKFDKKNANSDFDLSKNVINSYNYTTNEILKFDDRDSILNGQNTYHIQLNILNDTELSIELFKNNISIKKQQIKGELKKDGMFYLDNKYMKCNGIPYLFGGCNNNKRRITLSKNNNLIINEALDNTGALLFLFWAGQSYNGVYEFKRLE
ncbi:MULTISPECIES: hypothetical protein [unclassified Flavobacterium]|jgi:hypothetical protein|uniref:hypothetical protein n=1 Tax=unclassified Flavobacterium TaxID=196869 RepID=UPI0012A7F6A9|nr:MULTISPECIES: hypothetical protein [unclassified Flavobacterium]MBF4484531.1 hypothetical protein [Flavobacterium sp. CSZ]QGK72945.1 hypothetical protein GIY83_02330 [Flavobacterium sp. SLB02]